MTTPGAPVIFCALRLRISFNWIGTLQLPLRKVVFWAHLVCGLSVGVVVFMMSVTGVLLTYQKQMTEWSDRAAWSPPASDTRAPLSDFVETAVQYDPEATVSSLMLYADPEGPVGASLGGGRTLYMDPSTADVRGESNPRMRAFFSAVMGTHRWFNLTGDSRATGKAVTGWSNLVFLFLVVSGIYLWFPRKWASQHFRAVLFLKRGARGKARDFNWHHVFGFWTAIPLALIVASATVISFPWASNLAYRVMGDAPPVRAAAPAVVEEEAAEPAPFDVAVLDAVQPELATRIPDWRMITLRVPGDVETPIEARIDQGWGGEPQKRHTVRYDAASGQEVAYEAFDDRTRGSRFRTFLRFAHTGEFFGVFGQTVAGIVTLLSVILVWTGFALAWRRLVRTLLRRRGFGSASSSSDGSGAEWEEEGQPDDGAAGEDIGAETGGVRAAGDDVAGSVPAGGRASTRSGRRNRGKETVGPAGD